jgi:serine protease Do
MFYLNSSAKRRQRLGLLFLLGSVIGLCTLVNNARGADDIAADVSRAKSLSRVCQHVAQAMVPTVVRVARRKTDASSALERSESPAESRALEQSSGAGLIIEHSLPAKSATILTSYSNVRDGTDVTVITSDGREFLGVDVKGDAATDVAIVRITGIEEAKAAQFGDSDELELGQLILALGHPLGLSFSVSMGVVSGKGRQLGAVDRTTMIQTDAAANAGSAGGPLVNLDGEVVGMVSAIASQSGGFDGVAFAVPINHARFIAQQLMQHGRVPRGRLGLAIRDLTPELRANGTPISAGVLVTTVLEESPAAKAGLRSGDIIVEFAGSKVSRTIDLQMTVDRTPIGTEQELKLIRDGKEMSVAVVLEEMTPQQ